MARRQTPKWKDFNGYSRPFIYRLQIQNISPTRRVFSLDCKLFGKFSIFYAKIWFVLLIWISIQYYSLQLFSFPPQEYFAIIKSKEIVPNLIFNYYIHKLFRKLIKYNFSTFLIEEVLKQLLLVLFPGINNWEKKLEILDLSESIEF